MAIDFAKYVRIDSGVGGGAAVSRRDLIGRILTDNPLTPSGSVLEFSSAADVSAYYGPNSTEADVASFYFGWVSPAISRAQRISFGRSGGASQPARLYSNEGQKTLGSFTGIAAGTLNLVVDEAEVSLTPLDFTAASSLADVATVVQTALAAQSAPVDAITVNYDAASRRFVLTGPGSGVDRISMGETTQTSDALGLSVAAIISPAQAERDGLEALTDSVNISDNFGALAFFPRLDLDQALDVAEFVAAQNVKFQLMVPVARADAESWGAALGGLSGVALTLAPIADEYPELVPMVQLAATNYTRRNAVGNYMFKQFPLTPSVTTTLESDALDALRINYYGQTKTAGVPLSFYQRGVLMGGPTDPADMNVYANEQWLKDAAGTSIMSLLISANRVPANPTGRAQVLNALQETIDQALFNGVISIGRSLSSQQKAFISQQSGDDLAWQQVQSDGYWVDCRIESYVAPSGITEYRAAYVLLYAKDDAIRSVEGTHSLV